MATIAEKIDGDIISRFNVQSSHVAVDTCTLQYRFATQRITAVIMMYGLLSGI